MKLVSTPITAKATGALDSGSNPWGQPETCASVVSRPVGTKAAPWKLGSASVAAVASVFPFGARCAASELCMFKQGEVQMGCGRDPRQDYMNQ